MKKILSILISVSIVMSLCVFTTLADNTITFSDVDKNSESSQSIYKLAEAGILLGDGDGTFRPNDSITRAELSKIVNKIFNYTEKDVTGFSDVSEKDWYYNDVLIAKKSGYIVGFTDGTFRGEDNVSREQACTILCRVANLFDIQLNFNIKDEVSEWAMPYVQKVLSNGLMSLEAGDTFRATKNITRAEFCVAFADFYVPQETDETEYKVTVKDASGLEVKESKISFKDGNVYITLPDKYDLTKNKISVYLKDMDGKNAQSVSVVLTDKNNKSMTILTDKDGYAQTGSSSGGGGGGGGGNDSSDSEDSSGSDDSTQDPDPQPPVDYTNENKEIVEKLDAIAKEIKTAVDFDMFLYGESYTFVDIIYNCIISTIADAKNAIIDKEYIVNHYPSQVNSAKKMYENPQYHNNLKTDVGGTITLDTLLWLKEEFGINMSHE